MYIYKYNMCIYTDMCNFYLQTEIAYWFQIVPDVADVIAHFTPKTC